VLIVPVDISHSEAVDELPYNVHTNRPVIRPSDQDLDQMARLLQAGSNITIYAGSGCLGAHDQVVELAARLKAPVAHTSRGKDALEYDNPYNVGMTGVIGMESGYRAILNCDTLLLLGTDFAWKQFYPDHATIIQVDIDPMHIGRRHPVNLGVVGNIKDTLEALLPRIKQRKDSSFLDTYRGRHEKALKAQAERATPGHHGKIFGQYLTSIIDRLAAEDALFTGDDGTALVWLLRIVRANGKRRMFGSLLHGTMATSVGNAIGMQKAQPQRQVIALAGDGGLSMLMGDLLTLIQENLPIKIAVYDNGKLGFVELEQKGEGLLPVFTDLKNPDFGLVAQAMGLWGRTVTDPGEVESAVEEWLAQPGPALLNVKVAPMELVMPPFIAAENAYGMAMYSVRAVLHGQGGDVFEMIAENFPR
jgi:pyruvate dehydrogenase (quinone)